MNYAVIIRTNGKVEPYPKDHDICSYEEFEQFKRLAHMDIAEVVKGKVSDYQYLMLVDEEGKLLGKPINEKATRIYNNPLDVICGDVVLFDGDTYDEEIHYMSAMYRDMIKAI